MGCCALKLNDLPNAQRAFARVVQMHPDDAESWNNLAAVYISQNKKKEAFQVLNIRKKNLSSFSIVLSIEFLSLRFNSLIKALKHALQIKNDNWKIWENY